MEAEPMNVSRGYLGAFVMGEKLYAIGGVKENNEVLDIVCTQIKNTFPNAVFILSFY